MDCETDPFLRGRVPQPFIWGAYNGATEEYEIFKTGDEVAQFFRDRKVVVYAHNGGKFDYHYLRDYLNSDEPIMVINGRMAKFKIGEAEFRDSLNIFPNTRLADFGGKIEIDYTKMEADVRYQVNVWHEINLYLRQDCVLLWNMVDRYRREYGKNLTQAGASMRYWEKMSQLKAPRQTKTEHDLYKPFYYGGRVQCFESGVRHERFSVADINSAYPFAMLRQHPFSTSGENRKKLPRENKISQCLIEFDGTALGALPWRDQVSKELYFPDGGESRTYHVTGWELQTALELNAVKIDRIREVHCFPILIDFKEYIQKFFNLREEARKSGDVAGRIFGKYFMNSLYGKFGANCENYSEYVIASDDSIADWKSRGFEVYKPWGSRYLLSRSPTEDQLNDSEGRWRYYNVATAASVTGFVRSRLFAAMSQCEGLIYCDTDSIAAKCVSPLSFGTELGQWKHEGHFDSYAIAGKKLYAFHVAGSSQEYDPAIEKNGNWKIASKGVNFGQRSDGPELIKRIAQGESIIFNPEVPTYSITREEPVFTARSIKNTYKDMRLALSPKAA